jgi:hypothetical protein
VHQPGQPLAPVHEEAVVLDRRHDPQLRRVVGDGLAAGHDLLERRLELRLVLLAPGPRRDIVPEDPGAELLRDIELPAQLVDLLAVGRPQVATDQVVHDRYADIGGVRGRLPDHFVVLQVVVTVHRGDLQVLGR